MNYKKPIARRLLFLGTFLNFFFLLPAIVYAADEVAPEEEEIPTLPEMGVYQEIGEEMKVNLRIVGNNLQIYFLDLEDHVLPLEYQAARVRYEGFFKKDIEGVLTLGPGAAELGSILTHPRVFVRPTPSP
jgi:hypothetical protein